LYGDKKTEKTNTLFSPYNKIILDVLFKKSNNIYSFLVEKNLIENETKSLLNLAAIYVRFVNKIIEYSADDFQEIIEEVLIYTINLYEEIDLRIKQFRKLENENINKDEKTFFLQKSELLINYQNNLISIINMIFGKVNRIVKEEFIDKILSSQLNSLQINKEVYFNSINCIGYIVLSKLSFLLFDSSKFIFCLIIML
jgi:hypothetical protein